MKKRIQLTGLLLALLMLFSLLAACTPEEIGRASCRERV